MMISNSVMSTNILNIMDKHQFKLSKHMHHLATGQRVAGVADDPSGWAIGQRMDVRIRSLDASSRNAQFSLSMLKVAEGGVSSTIDILRNLKEKAIEAASDTCTDTDRRTIQKLFDQFGDQINDNAGVTYNGQLLLDGSMASAAEPTAQVLTNQSLATTTTANTKLTDLQRRDGSSLNIQQGDTVNLSYIKDGKTYSTSYQAGATTLTDMLAAFNGIDQSIFDPSKLQTDSTIGVDAHGETVHTADEQNAVSFTAAATGLDGAVAGITISITDSNGQIKKTATTALNDFKESIEPRDEQSDSSFYIASSADANRGIRGSIGDMSAYALGLSDKNGHAIDVTTQKGANAAMSAIDRALERALDQQTTIGAMSMRLEYTISNLTTESENLTAAMSTILDANMAKEMIEFTKENILLQAAQAMLAQNNHSAGWFLSLLQS
ncbi:MAG: flagellin [Selenomonas ruminantium]|jgi:flagellin|nr:flagellin [Selenomonas ruminantium]